MDQFDDNTPQRPISDEQRRLAETKKITLQPIHGDVEPESPSDAEIASRNAAAPALANTGSDIEQDASLVEPSKGLLKEPSETVHHSSISMFLIIAAAGILAVGIGFFIFIY